MNLMEYEKSVRAYMNKHNLSPATAVTHMMLNLRVMKDQYPIDPELNFRELGQQWNNLPSDTRNQQCDQLRISLSRSASRSSTRAQ